MTLGSRNRKLKTFTTRGTLAIAAIATTALAGLGGTAYLATDGFNSDDAPVATAEAPETAQNENCVEIQLNDGSVICIDPTLDTPLETIPTTEETTEVAAASAEAAEAALVEEDDTAEEGLTAEDLAETNDETEATDTVATVDLDDTSWQRDPLWKIKDEAVELFGMGKEKLRLHVTNMQPHMVISRQSMTWRGYQNAGFIKEKLKHQPLLHLLPQQKPQRVKQFYLRQKVRPMHLRKPLAQLM